MSTRPSKTLETFPNPNPGRDYQIRMECPEFTCLCPMTAQPDFATIKIRYRPNELCLELKSFKEYLLSFRNLGIFHEHVVNVLKRDLVKACRPAWLEIEGVFNARGGIVTTAIANYGDIP